ncbi:uncharacterized protein LOC106880523 [Octopus bimaculoides]|uniref:uncharacterized protein LOC106880523 n=1 Tax=Octopus bimaculoides TaxID=37653 RepID=UPI00071DC5B3|nr:uncharacterized protein LOC106880523 [Octopus bimaculoides]|eukprot:XP_014785985.1 PREDICTED: uncharacterized protein LOC106880523 [Octopus bimaculoides]
MPRRVRVRLGASTSQANATTAISKFPNPEQDAQLYNIVKKHIIHGPCGSFNPSSPCMGNNICTKRFPRPFVQETRTGHDGYPLYRRSKPEHGRYTATLKTHQQEVEVDNRWIVPFNKLLSKMFEAHISVESCNSVKSIKYICKYINKGSDMAVFGINVDEQQTNEIRRYLLERYISSNEAIWRIFEFPLHRRYPTVVNLAVHLESGERVYFTEDNAQQKFQQPPKTTLTAFFDLCKTDNFARSLLYVEVPVCYTW